MKKNIFILFVVFFSFIKFVVFCSFCIAANLNLDVDMKQDIAIVDQNQIQPQNQAEINNLNFNKLKYPDFLKLYLENMKIADYEKALFYARMSFSNATNIEQRANSILSISDVYVAMGDNRKAKMIYRQIIQNYYKQESLVKEAKKRLLKL